ncbi:MAG TPA: helix-hairpin-helix domain-containing protein, partial [Anaerolineae bacterium]
GIGPTYARRLNEAGVQTLADLARQTPERIREIVKLKRWQGGEPEGWIEEARALTVMLNDEAHEPAVADSQPATYQSQTAQ